MSGIKCIAFDCFGTVFSMKGVTKAEIADYVAHVRKETFEPYVFPKSFWHIAAHADAAEGIKMLQTMGFDCVTLSNGDNNLIFERSMKYGIDWDTMIDLRLNRVYKPNIDAYRTIEKELGFKPEETLMVTGNPTFGDIEGAAAIGMQSQVIRQPGMPKTIIELAEKLGG